MPLIKKKLKKVIRKILQNDLTKATIIVLLSLLPFLHDIITIRGQGVVSWLPDLGIEKMLTYSTEDGRTLVHGFSSYRVFLYTLFIHLSAAIGWSGWFLVCRKRYRFAILVPLTLSFYTVFVLLFNAKATRFGAANSKLLIVICLSILIVLRFFLNYKILQNKKP